MRAPPGHWWTNESGACWLPRAVQGSLMMSSNLAWPLVQPAQPPQSISHDPACYITGETGETQPTTEWMRTLTDCPAVVRLGGRDLSTSGERTDHTQVSKHQLLSISTTSYYQHQRLWPNDHHLLSTSSIINIYYCQHQLLSTSSTININYYQAQCCLVPDPPIISCICADSENH